RRARPARPRQRAPGGDPERRDRRAGRRRGAGEALVSRAVITGVGVVSAFGVGAGVFLDALAAGNKAGGPIRSFEISTFPVEVAGEVPVVDIDAAWMHAGLGPTSSAELAASGAIDRLAQEGWFRDRKVAFGLLAAAEALHDAGARAGAEDAWLVVALGLEV